MRVSRTFGFTDLCGFTSYTAVHGDELAVQLLGRFRAITREVASRRGVRVAQWVGDGAMFVSVERDTLVAAVLEIEQILERERVPLPLRAGVSHGDVILFEGDDYIGSAVNLAARLCDLAAGHEILATPDVVEGIPPWADAEPAAPMVVRGFNEPVELCRVHLRVHEAAAFVDPLCRMELPADGVVATRQTPTGEAVGFCSESCAAAWEGRGGEPALAPPA